MMEYVKQAPEWELNAILTFSIALAIGMFVCAAWDNLRHVAFFHEEIAAAAVKYPDIGVLFLPAPARHHHIMWTRLLIDGRRTGGDCEQGFVTTNGRFVGREEGLKIALKRGQVEEKNGNETLLFSEDMWPTPLEARGWCVAHDTD